MDKPKTKSKITKNKQISTGKLISEPVKYSNDEYDGRYFDRMLHASLSRFGGWLSPAAFMLSLADWLSFLIISPAKQQDLRNNAIKKMLRFCLYCYECSTIHGCEPCVLIRKADHRFQNELWHQPPFNLYSQSFLLTEQWWDDATTYTTGVSKHHQRLINFIFRQLLDIFSPSNFSSMNPEVIAATIQQNGVNFINGFNNYIEDVIRYINNKPPVGSEKFKVGVNVAITPGKVIYRNRLIELIQYSPTTPTVYSEPILIVPAWIMKYYILDLSEHNSMVKYLVDKGHTVFMISWKNPTSEDRNLGLEDYVQLGVMEALNVINQVTRKQKIHTVGYCIGGTLLMMAVALMAAKSEDRIKTISLFAAEIDFKDAGELLIFIDEKQISYLEDIMWEKGYLDGAQMAGAFSMLRSIDLIWSRIVRDYLLGERQPVTDLMAWDYDTTRLPYKMHTEYLRNLFLNNDLVEGRFKMFNKIVSLADINVPIFAVSTVKDHVSPWKSVYKIHFFTETEVTFVLTNAGHNTGIVNEPNQPGRNYQMLTHKKNDKHIAPETWQEKAPNFEGSWWNAWENWITGYSGKKIKPPTLGNPRKDLTPLCDAPGTYIYQK